MIDHLWIRWPFSGPWPVWVDRVNGAVRFGRGQGGLHPGRYGESPDDVKCVILYRGGGSELVDGRLLEVHAIFMQK